MLNDILRIQTNYNYELSKIRHGRGKRSENIAKLANILFDQELSALKRRFIHYYGKEPSAPHTLLPLAYLLIDALLECRYEAITADDAAKENTDIRKLVLEYSAENM